MPDGIVALHGRSAAEADIDPLRPTRLPTRHPGFTRPNRGDRLRLWNLANRIPADQRFTRRFEGHGELIDKILVSHTLLNPLPDVEVMRQAGQDQLPSITPDAAARRTQPASDHAAVLARLQL